MHTFRTLDLAIQLYASAKRLRLPAHLRAQLLRAASSIALNLSEGDAKTSPKDQRRFFEIAMGSLRECQTVFRLESVSDPVLLDLADHLGASLNNLIRRLE